MCSQREAFGRVTFEAMRAGLPGAGRIEVAPEMVETGVGRITQPDGNANALAANLMTLE